MRIEKRRMDNVRGIKIPMKTHRVMLRIARANNKARIAELEIKMRTMMPVERHEIHLAGAHKAMFVYCERIRALEQKLKDSGAE